MFDECVGYLKLKRVENSPICSAYGMRQDSSDGLETNAAPTRTFPNFIHTLVGPFIYFYLFIFD